MPHAKYAKLFTEVILNNGVSIPNHLAVAPITHFSSNEDGSLSDEEREYTRDRASDFGLYVFAATLVERTGQAFYGQPYALSEADLPSLAERATLIKQANSKAILQLHHGGFRSMPDLVPNGKLYSASAVHSSEVMDSIREVFEFLNNTPKNQTPKIEELTQEHIQKIIAGFGKATELAIKSGWDGVEIHGANYYLIQQFFSPATNHRTDQWGGTLEKRLAFPLAVVDAVVSAKRTYGSDDFIVGYRFSPEEPFSDGITMAETIELVKALKEKPLQYVHVSLHNFFAHNRRGAPTNKLRLETIRETLGSNMALMGVGGLLTVDDVLKAYDTGTVDFVAVGRANIINRYFARLIKEGREHEIETAFDLSQKSKYGIPEALSRYLRMEEPPTEWTFYSSDESGGKPEQKKS